MLSHGDSNVLNRPRLGRMTQIHRASGMRYHSSTTICGGVERGYHYMLWSSPDRMSVNPYGRPCRLPIASPRQRSMVWTNAGAALRANTAQSLSASIQAIDPCLAEPLSSTSAVSRLMRASSVVRRGTDTSIGVG